ncbi:hypothetical protein VIGAN_10199200, partial [Vigna angularis var. angularis]
SCIEALHCHQKKIFFVKNFYYLCSFYKYINHCHCSANSVLSFLRVTMALTRAILVLAIFFTLVAISTSQAPSPAPTSFTLPSQMSPTTSPTPTPSQSPSPSPGPSTTSSPPSPFTLSPISPSPTPSPSSASADYVPARPSNAFLRGTSFFMLPSPIFAAAAMLLL